MLCCEDKTCTIYPSGVNASVKCKFKLACINMTATERNEKTAIFNGWNEPESSACILTYDTSYSLCFGNIFRKYHKSEGWSSGIARESEDYMA